MACIEVPNTLLHGLVWSACCTSRRHAACKDSGLSVIGSAEPCLLPIHVVARAMLYSSVVVAPVQRRSSRAAEIFTCKSWLEQVCCVDVARFTTCCTEHQIQFIGEDWNPVPCPLPSGFLAVPGSRCPALSTFFTLACPPYFFNQPVIIIFVTYNGGVLCSRALHHIFLQTCWQTDKLGLHIFRNGQPSFA